MGTRMKILRMGALAFVGIGLWASVGAAEVRVCNGYSLPVYVAIGYETASDFKTEGWWLIQPDSCRLVDSRPVQGPYYLHAHTAWMDVGEGQRGRQRWGKGQALAVSRQAFTFVRADHIAADDEIEEFSLISQANCSKITYTVVDAAGSETACYS